LAGGGRRRGGAARLPMTVPPSLHVELLTRLRDARLVWDVMGPIYNRHIYTAIAALYEDIAAALKMPGPVSILDVGAGRGYMSLRLAAENPEARIVGIDYSPLQVRAAERYRRRQKITNGAFLRGNAMDIRFAEATFDGAVSVGSIKHWPDPDRGLREIRRVLKPGGCLVVSETDREATDDELRDFINRFRILYIPDFLLFWGLRQVVFGQSFSEAGLAAAVNRAGFRDLERRRTRGCPYVTVKAWK